MNDINQVVCSIKKEPLVEDVDTLLAWMDTVVSTQDNHHKGTFTSTLLSPLSGKRPGSPCCDLLDVPDLNTHHGNLNDTCGTCHQASVPTGVLALNSSELTPIPPPPSVLHATKKQRTHADNVAVPSTTTTGVVVGGCFASTMRNVYLTQSSLCGESLRDLARRQGYSPLMLASLNPDVDATTVLPDHIALFAWEQASHTTSCFELTQHACVGEASIEPTADLRALIRVHVGQLHKHIRQPATRIASHTTLNWADAPQLVTECPRGSTSPATFSTITLPQSCTFTELQNDPHLLIDWDAIACESSKYPAIFRNSRGNEYTFLFEKFMQNGNCKGKQIAHASNKMTNYVNTAGLSTEQLSFPKHAILPCKLPSAAPVISQCLETPIVVDTQRTVTRFPCDEDTRELYAVSSSDSTSSVRLLVSFTPDTHIEDHTTIATAALCVGMVTTHSGRMCYTLFVQLHRLFAI